MATPVIMPRQGQSVESCIIGKWYKQVGDKVTVGEDLFTYETDKAAFDEAAKVDGEILAIFFQENDDVPCLMNVCVIGEKGEDFSVFDPNGSAAPASAESAATPAPAAMTAAPAVTTTAALGTPVGAISPRAKGVAQKHTVDLRQVAATGPKGRIIERDVLKAIDEGKFATGAAGTNFAAGTAGSGIGGRVSVADLAAPAASVAAAPAASAFTAPVAERTEEKHSNIRKLIAKSTVEISRSVGPATLSSISMTVTLEPTELK